PDARQEVIRINSDLFIIKRSCGDRGQTVFAISNVTERKMALPLASLGFLVLGMTDLLEEEAGPLGDTLTLMPYQTVWLTCLSKRRW
ncbi:hypothetical protein Q4595_24875, partial [Wenyingzhuangia sp. 1_MG-2023]|nr:hypothetical protein [Wenyingzhuangia sp. 1_MG-2023]